MRESKWKKGISWVGCRSQNMLGTRGRIYTKKKKDVLSDNMEHPHQKEAKAQGPWKPGKGETERRNDGRGAGNHTT